MFLRARKARFAAGVVLACAPFAGATVPFSIELDGLADFATISPYSDASTLFGPWKTFDSSQNLSGASLSSDNYPTIGNAGQAISYLRTYPGWREGTPGNRPTVNYLITWDGGATDGSSVSFFSKVMGPVTNVQVGNTWTHSAILPFKFDDSSGEGTLTLRVDNTMLTQNDTAVSNLHIVPQQYYVAPQAGGTPLFRDEFLRKISPFNTLRFMDWQQTNSGNLEDSADPNNDHRVINWADRVTTTTFSRTVTKGIPYEEIIALANTSKKNIWINIPDRATNDFATGLGTMLKNSLNADSDIHIEYSNELWNTSGNQRWLRVLRDGQADTTGAHPVFDGGDPGNDLRIISREAARRVYDVSQIVKAQLGQISPARAAKVLPVLSGQTPNPQYLQYGLEYLASLQGVPAGQPADLSGMISSIAIAPYVGNDLNLDEPVRTVANGTPVKDRYGQVVMRNGQPVLGPDPDGKPVSIDANDPQAKTDYLNWLFPNLQNYINTTLRTGVRGHEALAEKYNLKLTSYEGGQHLVAYNFMYNSDINAELKVAANNDPRMALVYRDLIDMWAQETRGGLFTQFSLSNPYSGFGSWGLVESLTQQHSVKWDFFLNELAGDANLDGVVDFNDFVTLETNFNKTRTIWADGDFNLDGVVDYSDFLIFRSKFTPTGPAQAMALNAFSLANVPEPSALGLAMMGAVGFLSRRRRTR